MYEFETSDKDIKNERSKISDEKYIASLDKVLKFIVINILALSYCA